MKKKIGIITLQNANNFGASCQMYAFYNTVKKIPECDVCIINVFDEVIENRYKLLDFNGGFKSLVKQCMFMYPRIKEKNKFSSFRKNINMTEKVMKKDLSGLEFDIIIAGSDQIWNITLTGRDSIYFLEWVKNSKKISYAASFGVGEFDENFRGKINSLRDFKCLSVREKNAQKFLLDNDIPADCHVDPIFLMNEDEWSNVAVLPKIKEPYLLIYTIGYSDKIVEFSRKYAREHNLKLVNISNDVFAKKDMQIVRGIGPREWIGFFKNASCVITNSFHGVAFSIRFNKEFFVDNVKTNLKDTNARVVNILETFDIKNRSINGDSYSKLNWDDINSKIEIEKNRSIQYINQSINGKR